MKRVGSLVLLTLFAGAMMAGASDFRQYIKNVEGGWQHINPRTGRWMPYKDPSGYWTIGVGHLIGDGKTLPSRFRNGWSPEQVEAQLDKDIVKHAERAKRKVGEKVWNSLDERRQQMLTDIEYNGGIEKFPKFKAGVIAGDELVMAQEHHRKAKIKGEMTLLTGRNSAFARYFGLPYDPDGNIDPRPKASRKTPAQQFREEAASHLASKQAQPPTQAPATPAEASLWERLQEGQ